MKNKLSLNANQLKLLACLFMFIDHIGYFIYPDPGHLWLRIIGRLAFPIFAYMIANGYKYTSSPWRYLLRLAIFAVAFQPIYAYCMGTRMLSIFSTLALGLLAIICYEKSRARNYQWLGWLAVAALAALAQLIQTDYAAYGVLLIFTAHLLRGKEMMLGLAWALLNLGAMLLLNISNIQLFSLFALPLIFAYNGQPGRGNRWFFYAFYCLHIPLLWWISTLIG